MNYKIKSGDTLSAIAKRSGVSVSDLVKANPNIKDPNYIQAGWTLKLPKAARDPSRGDNFKPAKPNPRQSLTDVPAPARPPVPVPSRTDQGVGPIDASPPVEVASPIEVAPPVETPSPAQVPAQPASPAQTPIGGVSPKKPRADDGPTFHTPRSGKSANGDYDVPACTFPSFSKLSPAQRSMLGPGGRKKYMKLDPEQRASFLNITSAMSKAGIDLSGLRIREFNSDRVFLEPKNLDAFRAQLERNENFDLDKPKGKFHAGMTDFGVRQGTDLNSLQVGMGPAGAFIDIDRGNPKASVVGFFAHLGELMTEGKTNPFAIGEKFGPGQTGYTVEH